MASIKKRDGKWQARVSYKDKNGQYRTKSSGGYDTRREAEYWASNNEVRKYNVDDLQDSNVIFADYFKQWYETFKKDQLAYASQVRYVYTLTVITNEFGNTLMAAIDSTRYQQFLNKYGATRAKSSTEKIDVQIKGAVRQAVDDGLIRKDFTRNTHLVGRASKEAELKYLNEDETKKLLADCKHDISMVRVSKVMTIIALLTGARYAEIAGLTWDCIDWDNNTININKSWDYLQGPGFKPTKNPQSKRSIKVNDDLLNVLRSFKLIQEAKLEQRHIKNKLNLVCLNQNNEVPSNTACNKFLHAKLKQLGCQQISFHGLRHTHASYLIFNEVSIYYISQRLGHASYTTTLTVYSHIINEMKKREAQKTLDALDKLD